MGFNLNMVKGIYKTACFTNSCGMAWVGVLDSLLCGSRLKASRGSKGECFVALASCVVSGYCCAPSALHWTGFFLFPSRPPAPNPLGPWGWISLLGFKASVVHPAEHTGWVHVCVVYTCLAALG